MEAQYFGFGDETENFQANSNNFPVLARPYFNAQTGAAAAELIGFPGTQTGTMSVAATTGLHGADVLLRKSWYQGCDGRLDFLFGYRYLRLSDDLDIGESVTFTNNPAVPVNSTLAVSDRFSTLNEFNGVDLGIASEWRCHRWNLGFLLKVGMGNTGSHVSIIGNNVATEPMTTPVASPGGFLAQASNSNMGNTFEYHHFTMVPEFGINVGFDLTPWLRLVGGYSLIYWSSVARTGDQVDLNLTYPEVAGTPLSGVPLGHDRLLGAGCEPGAGSAVLDFLYRVSHHLLTLAITWSARFAPIGLLATLVATLVATGAAGVLETTAA